jgi:hypothetical protein
LIKAADRKICSEIYQLVLCGMRRNCLRSGRGSSLYLFFKKGYTTDHSNCGDVSLLSTMYVLSNLMLSRLTTNAEEIIGDHHCGFQHNRSATNHIFCICQILEKKWENNAAVHWLFIHFEQAYSSLGMYILYNFLIEIGKANANASG